MIRYLKIVQDIFFLAYPLRNVQSSVMSAE